MRKSLNLIPLISSKLTSIALFGIPALIIVLVVFGIGEVVGYAKALHTVALTSPTSTTPYTTYQAALTNALAAQNKEAHGSVGLVLATDPHTRTIVLHDADRGIEAIMVATSTIMQHNGQPMFFKDITPNERLVVIGAPHAPGIITAHLIQVF